MTRKIEIWGTLPPPIGGVSIHIKRLFEKISETDLVTNVILKDFNGESTNESHNIYKVQIKFWEFLRLLFVSKRIIHLHSSNYFAWFFILIFGFRHKIIITLHNQKFRKKKNFIISLISKYFLQRVKYILINDYNYKNFLKTEFQLDENKLKIVSAYIPPLSSEYLGLPNQIRKFIDEKKFVISANGFGVKVRNGRDLYGLDILIDIVIELKSEIKGIGLVYLLPQIGDKKYFNSLIKKIEDNNVENNILIFQKQIINGFEIWQNSDLFIRPTQTDIEGISVKESLSFGTPVIASNVCVRPKECIIYEEGNIIDLKNKIINIYHTPPTIDYRGDEAFYEILKLYVMV